MIVNNKHIKTPTHELILEVQRQVHLSGGVKLSRVIPKNGFDMITCPNDEHRGGQERNPSCTVLTEDKGEYKDGHTSCFACGFRASFPKFISTCFGIHDNGAFGLRWLEENADYEYIDDVSMRDKSTKKEEVEEEPTYVTEEELSTYRFYHPYMWERKLTQEVVDKFDIGYDKDLDMITFPVYDTLGRCLYVVKRSVATKFYHIPKNIKKEIFGMNHITQDINKVIICESAINALTCWTHAKPAIALFGTGSAEQIEALKKSHVRHFVLGFDGDSAGGRAFNKFKEALSNKVVTMLNIPNGKDINDLTYDEFESLQERISWNGKR